MKLGLALGGGGAKGCAHIGVLRALEAAHVNIDIVTGTSAGAIIGALYAAGKTPDEIEAIARRLRVRDWMHRDESGLGMFSTAGIRRIVEKEIGKDARIEDLPKRFAAVAVDLNSRAEVVIDSGLVADAVCASAAFPGLFAPVPRGDYLLIDGGALNPVPFDVARRLGAQVVVAIDLQADEPLFTSRPLHRNDAWFFRLVMTAEQQKTFRVLARAVGVMTRRLREQKLRQAPPDLLLKPNVQGIGLMDFDLIDECVAAGEAVARAALPDIIALCAPSLAGRWRRLRYRLKRETVL